MFYYVGNVVLMSHELVHRVDKSVTHMQWWRHHMIVCSLKLSSSYFILVLRHYHIALISVLSYFTAFIDKVSHKLQIFFLSYLVKAVFLASIPDFHFLRFSQVSTITMMLSPYNKSHVSWQPFLKL